jgi:hypothetical protein
MKSIHERLNLLVFSFSLSFYLPLNKGSRYTNEDDSYIFVPAEPANASPLVVHRNSGDIALDCRSLNSRLTAYKYLLRDSTQLCDTLFSEALQEDHLWHLRSNLIVSM